MKTLESVFKAATVKLADHMTEQLQYNAIQGGWPKEAISGVSVGFTGSSIALTVNENVKDLVMTYEYGTERVRPSSVLRRTANMSDDFEKEFISQVDQELRRII